MKPMTRITPRIGTDTLSAGLAGLLIGIALTFSIVLGTHWFERVRTVQVVPNTTGSGQPVVALPFADAQSVDAANMIRHDPVGQAPVSAEAAALQVDQANLIRHDPIGQSPASVAADQSRVDQENMIRHDPVGSSPASVAADQSRVDQENMIRHDPPLSATNQ